MGGADPHSILRPVSVALQLVMLGLVAAAATYLGAHGSPDPFQQLVVVALVPTFVGLLALGIAGLALYLPGRTVIVLVVFDCIAVIGPLFYALLGLASRDIRLFLFAVVVTSVPIIGAVGAVIVQTDRPPRAGPPQP